MQSDEELTAYPERSLSSRIVTWLECSCTLGVRLSLPILFVLVGSLLLYVVGGVFVTTVGIWNPQYQFLSLTSDRYFTTLGLASGATVCVETALLIIVHILNGVEGTRNQISLLAAFVGFGLGAAVVRITGQAVLHGYWS